MHDIEVVETRGRARYVKSLDVSAQEETKQPHCDFLGTVGWIGREFAGVDTQGWRVVHNWMLFDVVRQAMPKSGLPAGRSAAFRLRCQGGL
jgi:hypothetical protein